MSEQEQQERTVTSPKAWADKNLNTRLVELPSGAVFRVRNLDLPTMVSKGYLPLELVNSFSGIANAVKQNQQTGKTELSGIAGKDLADVDTMCRKLIAVAVIEPRISAIEPTSDTVINVNDLGFGDVIFIFAECVKGGGGAFAGFFRGRQPSFTPGADGGEVRAEAVGNSGDNRPDLGV
ncbi:MAG: hypothetical protein Q7J73_00695 [Dehalococcoidales bacterium]|nr:hypothetical protein [Dehalococcoidales bacterium]